MESLERAEYEHPHAVKYYVNDALVPNRVTESKLTYDTLPQTLYWDKSKVLCNNAAVFAKEFIPCGTRYGPFKGKLTPYVHRIHGRGKAHPQVKDTFLLSDMIEHLCNMKEINYRLYARSSK